MTDPAALAEARAALAGPEEALSEAARWLIATYGLEAAEEAWQTACAEVEAERRQRAAGA